MNADQINDLAQSIHAANVAVGWWDDPDRCLVECLQLVSTEVAEATEAARKDLMDDHLPHRKGEEVELADAMIRLLDLGGSQGWRYTGDWDKEPDYMRGWSVGRMHFEINMQLVKIHTYFEVDSCYSDAIDTIAHVAAVRGHDLWAAVAEKVAYNAQRADHKREHRAQAGGKKF